MNEYRGWLLDLYADKEDGVVFWLIDEDGHRRRLHQDFPVTFYAAGPERRLDELQRFLSGNAIHTATDRDERRDLFSGMLDLLSIQTANPVPQSELFRQLRDHFPDLDYFDADIPIELRHAVAYDVFPLARCRVIADEKGAVSEIEALDSAWDMEPVAAPLRHLVFQPDVDPSHAEPAWLAVSGAGDRLRLPLSPVRSLLVRIQGLLRRHDPDLIVTQWGDTWLFPFLLDAARRTGATFFNLNRDENRRVVRRRENSFFTYGRVVYRGQQVHLFGRWHLDERNAVMYGGYGLAGVLEQARVSGLPVQEVARKSPGAGITAMQMQTALRSGVLVPYQKQQAEAFRSAREHIRADRGGLVYQPLIGLHRDVAEIDFVSMYPSIMVNFNISPETVGEGSMPSLTVPELGIPVSQSEVGLVPRTLKPLLERRLAIKKLLATMDRRDCRYRTLKARSDALKWLLVVCFGYLGYKNARFGRIESHEAVTAYGREALLRAKEAAEDMGYTVLHMYVDGLWVRHPELKKAGDFQPLLDEITLRTGLPIALDGIYRWVAFLASRDDASIPVPNRYFGLYTDGQFKLRGIEARRHDTAPFIADAQLAILSRMVDLAEGRATDHFLDEARALLEQYLASLRGGKVGLEKLLVSQTLSRSLSEYRVLSPAARAAAQLEAIGKRMNPGQRVRFLYTLGEPGVLAWDLPAEPDPAAVDVPRYEELLVRAISTVTGPLGAGEPELRQWMGGNGRQQSFLF
ncbi:MAG: DNA polymerase domain-containing protein [Candidatus Promineifilaceae bacterium]